MLLPLWIACHPAPVKDAPAVDAEATGDDSASDTSVATLDTADTADTAAPDTADPLPAPYCRSLDPTWSGRYVDPLDRALADLIARQERPKT